MIRLSKRNITLTWRGSSFCRKRAIVQVFSLLIDRWLYCSCSSYYTYSMAKGLGDRLYTSLHKMPGEVDYSFCLFLKSKTLNYTHLEATSYIPQQGQSLHFWTTSLFTTGCYKNKYTIQFLWMACISRFAMAILSGETDLAFGTIRVNIRINKHRCGRGVTFVLLTGSIFGSVKFSDFFFPGFSQCEVNTRKCGHPWATYSMTITITKNHLHNE